MWCLLLLFLLEIYNLLAWVLTNWWWIWNPNNSMGMKLILKDNMIVSAIFYFLAGERCSSLWGGMHIGKPDFFLGQPRVYVSFERNFIFSLWKLAYQFTCLIWKISMSVMWLDTCNSSALNNWKTWIACGKNLFGASLKL